VSAEWRRQSPITACGGAAHARTNGRPGGKQPLGNFAVRSPPLSLSAASRKAKEEAMRLPQGLPDARPVLDPGHHPLLDPIAQDVAQPVDLQVITRVETENGVQNVIPGNASRCMAYAAAYDRYV